MKKILALVLCVVAVFAMSTTAFAAEQDQNTVKYVELTGRVYDTFEVTIPASVDLKKTGGEILVTVNSMNISPDRKLGIFYERSSMESVANQTPAELEFSVDGVVKDDLLQAFTEPGSVSIHAKIKDGVPAGDYTGYVVFSIFAASDI